MNTSDPEIIFDAQGVCNHCHKYDIDIKQRTVSDSTMGARLNMIVEQIKKAGKGKEYDCIIGVSGGVDSTYVAYKTKELGLRPLAVHLDNGWDSELAVKNIEQVLKGLDIELYTHVIDWNEFKDLQLAFLKASTPDSEIPTDHAITALMFEMAKRFGLKYILSGVNVRTESHLPRAWSQGHLDWKYIRAIHRQFGTQRLTSYPHQGLLQSVLDRLRLKWIDLLNYVNYSKTEAMDVLQNKLGWKYYGGKHYESIYTRFYQGYILPKKFGYDKRRTHLSSLICSGEITREAALKELEKSPYPEDMQKQDREYVVKKLGLTDAEFEAIMTAPSKRFEDYPSYAKTRLYKILRWGHRTIRRK